MYWVVEQTTSSGRNNKYPIKYATELLVFHFLKKIFAVFYIKYQPTTFLENIHWFAFNTGEIEKNYSGDRKNIYPVI